MSSVVKWLSGFCSSGLVATCSLTLVNKNVPTAWWSEQIEETAPPKRNKEYISLAQQIIEKGYKSCFILPNNQGHPLLYVCLKNDDSLNPSFFYYNRFAPKEKQIIKQVEYIEGKDETLPRFAVMKFVDGNSLTLKYAPYFWSRKGIQIKPEEHCKIIKDLRDDKLTCKTPNSEGLEYSRKIQSIL